MVNLAQVKGANRRWFADGNPAFFGDTEYKLHSRKGRVFLLRTTSMWSDMFGREKKMFVKINEVDSVTLKIGRLIDEDFTTYEEARKWIRENV